MSPAESKGHDDPILQADDTTDGVRFRVKVQVRARREELSAGGDGLLRIRVNAPALEGKANRAVVALLAKRLQVAKSSVKITAGDRAKLKTIVIVGLTRSDLLARLRSPRGD